LRCKVSNLSYCGWQGDALETVAQVEEFYARTCLAADFNFKRARRRALVCRMVRCHATGTGAPEAGGRSPTLAAVACAACAGPNECPLRLDTPAPILGDWLNESGWTQADLEQWYLALVLAFLEADGWHTAPDALPVEDSSTGPSWEFEVPSDR
jgi:hypothetical protein